MGLWQKWFGSKARAESDDAVHVYVECGRCKAVIHVRLDKRHDLSHAEGGGYFVRKEIMDGTCFRLMTAEITFDTTYRIRQQAVEGGRFLTPAEFAAASSGRESGGRPSAVRRDREE